MAEEEQGPQVVTLISSEGSEFVIERDAAMVSGTIKNMLSSPGKLPLNIAAFHDTAMCVMMMFSPGME